MSVITAITLQKNNKERCNLFVDGEFFAGVSLETVMRFRLKVNAETDAQKLAEILDSAEKQEATEKAIAYSAKSLKTKKQVKDYLLRRGYKESTVWYCIDKLKEYSYIDDGEYSKRYIESTAKTQGKRLIKYKLMMKGVKKEDIEKAFENAETDDAENARRLAEKHLRNKEITAENVRKTYKYLIGRGFSYEQADDAIKKFRAETDDGRD